MVEWILSSSVLILVVAALRFALRRKLSLRLQYALWLLVLVRLLVPVSFGSSPYSVASAVEHRPTVQAETTIHHGQTAPSAAETMPEASAPAAFPSEPVTVQPQFSTTHAKSEPMDVAAFLPWLWAGGTLALLAVFTASNLHFAHRLRKTRQLLGGVPAPLPVYVTAAIDAPCLFGLWRPAIYVTPEAAADPVMLRHTLAHEITHRRHGDHIWSLLRCLCLSVHWFNPLVWWAAVLSRNDGELACDEGATCAMGDLERAAYGRTLLSLTCRKPAALLNTATTMTGSRRSIRERIALLVKRPRTAALALVVLVVLAAVTVGCTFTGPQTEEPAAESAAEGAENPAKDQEEPESAEEPDGLPIDTSAVAGLSDSVLAAAKYYVNETISQLEEAGANPAEGMDGYTITEAKITALTPMALGEQVDELGMELYQLEYRIKPDHPENVVMAGGMELDDGWVTEKGSMGQPCLLLADEGQGPELVATFYTQEITSRAAQFRENYYSDADDTTLASMLIYKDVLAAENAPLQSILAPLTKNSVPVRLTLTVDGDSITYEDPPFADTEYYRSSAFNFYFYRPVENPETGDTEVQIAGDSWTIQAYPGYDTLILTTPDGTYAYEACQVPYGSRHDIGTRIRMWFDDLEFVSLGGRETDWAFYIEDTGQTPEEATLEYATELESRHTLVTSGSFECYSYVSCAVELDPEMTEHFRNQDYIGDDTWAFYLSTIFVPENKQALMNSMAGNTRDYDGDDPEVPDDALMYSRCCFIRQTDEGWTGQIGGTGW
jgi:beta-lactamase regulating signal transducer with metallopeptidase domain